MMIADFQPTLLTPLSHSEQLCKDRLVVPRAPRAGKKRSERVNCLLMDNLELYHAPMLSGGASSKRACLQLQPRLAESGTSSPSLLDDALERLCQKGIPMEPRRGIVSAKRRSKPTLPDTVARRMSGSNSSISEEPSPVAKHETERTPIRSPIQRSDSGLARCA
jgi:hypothetical protein